MKKIMCACAVALVMGTTSLATSAEHGVAIQRVITNTRSELGQLASSEKAQKISELMKKFDTQYQTWNSSCGESSINSEQISDACKLMAEQMRVTGISVYSTLGDYLPDVAARYEQGAMNAKKILESQSVNQTPADLYKATMDGITEAPKVGILYSGDDASPFDLEMDDIPDPTEKMFSVLEKLVPDFGKEIPEAVRAGNTQVTMMKKAKQARYLAGQFSKARFVLESQQEYGEIILNATKAVSAMPEVLGIQYTGTKLTAKPNRKVLEYYTSRSVGKEINAQKQEPVGGFELRS